MLFLELLYSRIDLHYWNIIFTVKLLWINLYCIKRYRNKGDLACLWDGSSTHFINAKQSVKLGIIQSHLIPSYSDVRLNYHLFLETESRRPDYHPVNNSRSKSCRLTLMSIRSSTRSHGSTKSRFVHSDAVYSNTAECMRSEGLLTTR